MSIPEKMWKLIKVELFLNRIKLNLLKNQSKLIIHIPLKLLIQIIMPKRHRRNSFKIQSRQFLFQEKIHKLH
jgi:hypothetical protein